MINFKRTLADNSTYENKDWPEDHRFENGMYTCRCLSCKDLFLGHKRRLYCKECYNE
jgi:hypothetical protein